MILSPCSFAGHTLYRAVSKRLHTIIRIFMVQSSSFQFHKISRKISSGVGEFAIPPLCCNTEGKEQGDKGIH